MKEFKCLSQIIQIFQIMILKLVCNERQTSHFTKIIDRGKKDKEGFFFLVMELAGSSLADLKRNRGKVLYLFVFLLEV